MNSAENFREYAADCVRQAEGQSTPEDKNILLNMALAWVRLAQQAQELPSLQDAASLQDISLQDMPSHDPDFEADDAGFDEAGAVDHDGATARVVKAN